MARDNWRSTLTICVVLGGLTLALFWRVSDHEFIVYDDGQYVFDNPHVASGLAWSNVMWAFTRFHSGNWHPLTWISHMVDVQFFGMKAGMHHLTNVFLHSANSVLLFLVLKRLTTAFWQSAIVAGFFAWHPAHVESVAWVAERKDLLCTFFGLLTLMAYSNYVSKFKAYPQTKRLREVLFFYLSSLLLFAFGLMSKPMLVTLPFVMLLLDYWPLGRMPGFGGQYLGVLKRLVLEKAPFFALTIASCIITFLAQKVGGAVDTVERVPLEARLSNAIIAYADYLRELVWPSKLAILYLRPEQWPVWRVAVAVTVLVVLTLLAAWGSRGRAWMSVGWFWFVGTLVPVIGIVQVGNQYMADRYTYIPFIGCFVIIVWGALELAKKSHWIRIAIGFLALFSIGLAGVLTHWQLQYWKNNETLFGRCIAVTRDNFSAHNILGVAMARQNRFAEARFHFYEALRIQPSYVDALQNLGILLTEHGDYDEAVDRLRQAVRVRPATAVIFSRLGLALDMKDLAEPAIIYYRESLLANPDQEDASNNLAWLLATCPEPRFRDGAEAVRLAEHICKVTSYRRAALIGTLGAAYAEAGRFPEAVATAENAIQVATAAGETELVQRNQQLLELYRVGKPYREPRPNASPAH